MLKKKKDIQDWFKQLLLGPVRRTQGFQNLKNNLGAHEHTLFRERLSQAQCPDLPLRDFLLALCDALLALGGPLPPWAFRKRVEGVAGITGEMATSWESWGPRWHKLFTAPPASACWWRIIGLPRWLSGQRIYLQCRRHRRHRFDPWVRKILWRRA